MTAPRTYHVKSFGCQMNVYDGERMGEVLADKGLSAVPQDEADLVVLNTCHIRDRATHRVYSEIGALRRDDGSKPMVALAGCVAQAEGEAARARTRDIDIVVGPQAYHRLGELVDAAAAGRPALDISMPEISKFNQLPARRKVGPTAFLSVQEGCDKFCTYCVVPYTRGAEVSRPFAELIDEAKALIDGGAKEITLLGQNVNAWADGDRGLHHLIAALDRLPGLARIRYTTSHPNDMADGLIEAHRDIEKLMPYMHLPVQSGSDRILRAMNRSHSRASYLKLIERVRAVRPDIALSGDFITGFPGETEEDFAQTLQIVEEAEYAAAFTFSYSPRPGTPAATMDDQVDKDVSLARLKRLQNAIVARQTAFNVASLGRRCEVLIERRGKLSGQWLGKSPWLQSVHVIDPTLAIGDLIEVELVQAGPNSLAGLRVEERAAA